MGVEHLGAPDWKPWIDESMEEGRAKAKSEAKARKEKLGDRFKGLNYAYVDPEVLYKYNAYDVAATHRLEAFFDSDLAERPELQRLYSHLLDISNMLVHVEQNGMLVDMDYNAQLEEEIREALGEIEFDTGGNNFNLTKTRKRSKTLFNPNSPPQVHKFLNWLGIKVEDTRKGTIADLVRHYELTGERDDILGFCKLLLEHRDASKTLGTFVLGLRNAAIDGVIHPDFGMMSKTGRLTGKNPNPQNFPRGSRLRKQIIPRPGKVFVHADYAQAELRVMCWLAKDENLRALFADTSIDIFDNMAMQMFGKAEFDSWTYEYRKNVRGGFTKPAAYGSAYGRGPQAIADSWGIPLWKARQLQQEFFKLIPDVVKFQQMIAEQAVAGEDVVTIFGRHRRFKLVVDSNYVDVMNEAKAFLPQSTANDICLTAAMELDAAGIPIVNLIHDDIMAEVDKCDAEEAMRLMSKVMVETAERITDGFVNFRADPGMAMSYGELK
jgi:DNA polymerase-1